MYNAWLLTFAFSGWIQSEAPVARFALVTLTTINILFTPTLASCLTVCSFLTALSIIGDPSGVTGTG